MSLFNLYPLYPLNKFLLNEAMGSERACEEMKPKVLAVYALPHARDAPRQQFCEFHIKPQKALRRCRCADLLGALCYAVPYCCVTVIIAKTSRAESAHNANVASSYLHLSVSNVNH